MKTPTILVAIILFTCFVAPQVTSRILESNPSLRNEKLHWPRYHKPPFHPPVAGKALPPLPSGHFHPVPFNPPPVVATCLSDFKEVRTCFADITRSFINRKPATIGSDCCAAIKKMKDDCEKTVFGSFHKHFFNGFVKRHCSNQAGSGSSPAPSPAPSSA